MKLCDPFGPDEVRYKVIVERGNQALSAAYITAQTVQDRLDAVLTPAGWRDRYELLRHEGSVVCWLSCRFDDEWITKSDVGSLSAQTDEGDKVKAGYSDALKRAAVKFGVGRYLYHLPALWRAYDPNAKAFVDVPTLPDWAQPRVADEGVSELAALIGQTQADVPKLLTHFKVNRLEDLTAEQYKTCFKMLQKKLKKAGATT